MTAAALACVLPAAGCGIGALVPDAWMPAEQRAGLVAQRAVLAPLSLGGSEIAVALAADEAALREAALAAPGGLEAGAERALAEAVYQGRARADLDLADPFTRFVLAARLWLAGEVDRGQLSAERAAEALAHVREEVRALRARRENFAPAAPHLRRTLWQAAPGTTLEGLQRESELYRRLGLACPTERRWGLVEALC